MVVLSVFILLIIFESSKLLSNAVNTYCTLPCPFMCPAQEPKNCGGIQLSPRTPSTMSRFSYYDTDYDETPDIEQPTPQPVDGVTRRQQKPPDPEPSTTPRPKPKPKPPPEEDPEPPPKKRKPSSSSPTPSPCIQPSRRFFTSLFSIPGAVVDTLIGGEITL